MKILTNDQGEMLFKAERSPTLGTVIFDFVKGNPSTMTKMVIAIAEAILMSDPNNASAKNTYRLGKDAKSLLSVYEVVALGNNCVEYIKKTVVPSNKKDKFNPVSEEDERIVNGMGALQMGSLTIGEGLSAYANMTKAGIVFVGTAAEVATAKFYSEVILGIGAVLGTIRDAIALHRDFNNYYEWNYGDKAAQYKPTTEDREVTKTKKKEDGKHDVEMDNLLSNIESGGAEHVVTYNDEARNIMKDKAFYKLFATSSDFLKTITYLGFGILTAMSIVAPEIMIPAEVVYMLTVSTIVWTITRHFAQEETRKLVSKEENLFIDMRGLNRA